MKKKKQKQNKIITITMSIYMYNKLLISILCPISSLLYLYLLFLTTITQFQLKIPTDLSLIHYG